MSRTPVSKPYLPRRERLNQLIDGVYGRGLLTNNGPLVTELTSMLEAHLGVKNILLTNNGTTALQIAYNVLGLKKGILDSPVSALTPSFTYIATASSLAWEGISPRFVDIEPDTWCMDPKLAEAAIDDNVRALVPVHVFGMPCNVEKLEQVAQKNELQLIYDASHAFGSNYNGRSLLSYGDAATVSFHATKLFHTIEGGAIIFKRKEDYELGKKLLCFGQDMAGQITEVGINAKMNEFQAAMGIAVLEEIDQIYVARESIWHEYDNKLAPSLRRQSCINKYTPNHSYFPIILKDSAQVLTIQSALAKIGVDARRYFFPPLNRLEIFNDQSETPIADYISNRVLCLPIYPGLDRNTQLQIIKTLNKEAAN